MNKKEEIQNLVKLYLNALFPSQVVNFEDFGEESNLIGVGVFGVQQSLVQWFEQRIFDIDEKVCSASGYSLIPLVRDEAVTKKFYPHFMTLWSCANTSKVSSKDEISELAVAASNHIRNLSNWPNSDEFTPIVSCEEVADATNGELALAA